MTEKARALAERTLLPGQLAKVADSLAALGAPKSPPAAGEGAP